MVKPLSYLYLDMSTNIRKRVNRKITRAVREFKLLESGRRVLIGLSGGKDSTTLLWELVHRKGKVDPDYTLEAMHLQSDFGNLQSADFLEKICKDLAVPFHRVPVNITARVKKGQSLNCWWCSTQRRAELLEFARLGNFDTLALGHHMDDMLETLLMNMLYQGVFSSMPPLLELDNYPIRIIRPLAYVENQELVEYVEDLGLAKFTCTCDFSKNSNRKVVRQHIQNLTGGNSKLKSNMFESMRQIRSRYLPA